MCVQSRSPTRVRRAAVSARVHRSVDYRLRGTRCREDRCRPCTSVAPPARTGSFTAAIAVFRADSTSRCNTSVPIGDRRDEAKRRPSSLPRPSDRSSSWPIASLFLQRRFLSTSARRVGKDGCSLWMSNGQNDRLCKYPSPARWACAQRVSVSQAAFLSSTTSLCITPSAKAQHQIGWGDLPAGIGEGTLIRRGAQL